MPVYYQKPMKWRKLVSKLRVLIWDRQTTKWIEMTVGDIGADYLISSGEILRHGWQDKRPPSLEESNQALQIVAKIE